MMYYMLLLKILFLVGLFHRELINAEINNNGELSLRDFGFDSNKLKKIEIIVTDILKNYISTPNNKLFRKKILSSPHNLDVTLISDIISNDIKTTFRNIGLINLNKKNKQLLLAKNRESDEMQSFTFRDSIIHELFDFISKLSTIVQAIASTLVFIYENNNYQEKGYLRSSFSLPKIITQSSLYELKIVSLADKSEKYIDAYLNCWNKNLTLFNASKALINLVKYPPKITGKIVKLRLSKSIPRNPYKHDKFFTEFDALTCQILTTNKSRILFENCLKQLELIEKCVEKTFNNSLKINKSKWRSGKMLKKKINNLNSSCKVKKNTTNFKLICDNIDENNNNNNSLLILIDKFVGNSFVRSVASRRVIENLGDSLPKDKSFAELLKEIKIMIEFYYIKLIQQNNLLKKSKNQPRIFKEYNKRSKELYRYTSSLTEIAMNIIDQIRRVIRKIEKVLVEIVSKAMGINISNNLRSMRCFDKLWNKIKSNLLTKLHFLATKSQTWQDVWGVKRPTQINNNSKIAVRSKNSVINLSTYFNNDWLNTMRGLARTNNRRNSNTIITLANVFLLATLFYEFIFIFTDAIYHREREPDIPSQPMSQPNFGFPDDVHGFPSYDEPGAFPDEYLEHTGPYNWSKMHKYP